MGAGPLRERRGESLAERGQHLGSGPLDPAPTLEQQGVGLVLDAAGVEAGRGRATGEQRADQLFLGSSQILTGRHVVCTRSRTRRITATSAAISASVP